MSQPRPGARAVFGGVRQAPATPARKRLRLRLIIFDCDGTLVDSQAVIIMAMAGAFARLGRPAPSAEAVRRIVGLSLPAAMSALLPDGDAALAERLAQAYREAHPSAVAAAGHKDAPYPGARETLEVLAAREYLLGIATGKGRNALNATLDPHGLTPFFTTFQTADRNAGKPHPEMVLNAMAETGAKAADTVVVGDTSYDMAMAVSAGVHAIGVAWGYHDPASLREAGAAHIAGSFHEIPDLVERLLGGN